MIYAYARVSSREQTTARQIDEFKKHPEIDVVVEEKASGKNFEDRPRYRGLRRRMKKGDTLIIMSLDRFGRNYDEIIEEWRYLVKEKGCNIKVLDMPILDTTAGEGLIGKFISDLVLQILSFVAQTEREKIHERQMQGIAAALARGVKFGRPKTEITDEQNAKIRQFLQEGMSLRKCAKETGVGRTMIWRMKKEMANEMQDLRE